MFVTLRQGDFTNRKTRDLHMNTSGQQRRDRFDHLAAKERKIKEKSGLHIKITFPLRQVKRSNCKSKHRTLTEHNTRTAIVFVWIATAKLGHKNPATEKHYALRISSQAALAMRAAAFGQTKGLEERERQVRNGKEGKKTTRRSLGWKAIVSVAPR